MYYRSVMTLSNWCSSSKASSNTCDAMTFQKLNFFCTLWYKSFKNNLRNLYRFVRCAMHTLYVTFRRTCNHIDSFNIFSAAPVSLRRHSIAICISLIWYLLPPVLQPLFASIHSAFQCGGPFLPWLQGACMTCINIAWFSSYCLQLPRTLIQSPNMLIALPFHWSEIYPVPDVGDIRMACALPSVLRADPRPPSSVNILYGVSTAWRSTRRHRLQCGAIHRVVRMTQSH